MTSYELGVALAEKEELTFIQVRTHTKVSMESGAVMVYGILQEFGKCIDEKLPVDPAKKMSETDKIAAAWDKLTNKRRLTKKTSPSGSKALELDAGDSDDSGREDVVDKIEREFIGKLEQLFGLKPQKKKDAASDSDSSGTPWNSSADDEVIVHKAPKKKPSAPVAPPKPCPAASHASSGRSTANNKLKDEYFRGVLGDRFNINT